MVERPILFSAPLVRAILDGRKSVTRRVVKEFDGGINFVRQITDATDFDICKNPKDTRLLWEGRTNESLRGFNRIARVRCPYGTPGDRLWVREAHHLTSSNIAIYRADYPANAHARRLENIPPESEIRWRPSIYMPRWASRILLEVTDVRVERLQAISYDDVEAEGVSIGGGWGWIDDWAALWDSINAGRGYGWDADPWVWVVSFRRVQP